MDFFGVDVGSSESGSERRQAVVLAPRLPRAANLLVEGLGVGGGAGNVGVTGGLVGAGGELELWKAQARSARGESAGAGAYSMATQQAESVESRGFAPLAAFR